MMLHHKPRRTSRNPPTSINTKSLLVIKHTAIDTSGRIGCLFDGHRNRVLRQLEVIFNQSSYLLCRRPRCVINSINSDQRQNLLKLIGMNEDLRLSILLDTKPKVGLASLIDYSHPINEYTRFLHYSYINHEEIILNNVTKIQETWVPQTQATHIIAGVSWGIEFVAVLQLPCDALIARKTNSALEKFRAFLENSNNFANLTKDDGDLLEHISVIKAYSNVSESIQIRSLSQIYQYIIGFQQKSDCYLPFSYTLYPIEWLYHDTHNFGPAYKPLEKSDSNKLEQYLIEILNELKQVQHLLDYNIAKVLPDHVKELLLEVNNEWQNLKNVYQHIIEEMRQLISDIRRGQKDAFEIDQILKYNVQTTLIENIRKLGTHVRNLETNIQFINSSEQKSLTYYGGIRHQSYENNNVQSLERNFNKKLVNKNQSMLSTKQLVPTDEIINILLLGESGVGKSTFINAFINYLTFNTLQQAEINKPVVLIPVSFLITVGNNFEEHTIKFDVSDKINNEDFDHPGQSVTQRCKSYVFDLKHIHGKKFRIIDTPGFGDTRGLNQDDLNMQHILEYINNLTHLNAICFLLKPNSSRLHLFFRTCLTQLLDLLGRNARENILFCFTNARSTFYTPGDTAPLLKTMLKSLPLGNISFKKENTFCFDNESFRYLLALLNGISFNHEDRYDYQASWSKSVTEINRLLNYICQNRTVCIMHNNWQSIKHAQLEIIYIVRPMLEAMRNLLRNIILCDAGPMKRSIIMLPKAIHHPITICLSCKHEPIRIANFWLLPDCQHNIEGNNHKCSSASNQHISLDYILDYGITDKLSIQEKNKLSNQVSLLMEASAVFSNFLMHTAVVLKGDVFLTGLIRMVHEEKYITMKRKENNLNIQLSKELEKLMHQYKYLLNEVKQNKTNTELSTIYNWIKIIQNTPEVHEQFIAVKKGQEYMMKYYEYEVQNYLKAPSIRQSVFL